MCGALWSPSRASVSSRASFSTIWSGSWSTSRTFAVVRHHWFQPFVSCELFSSLAGENPAVKFIPALILVCVCFVLPGQLRYCSLTSLSATQMVLEKAIICTRPRLMHIHRLPFVFSYWSHRAVSVSVGGRIALERWGEPTLLQNSDNDWFLRQATE